MRFFRFSQDAIDVARLRAEMADPACGGFVVFEGWVRNLNEGRTVVRLEYEAFEALAVKEGERIVRAAAEHFGVTRLGCIHRLGSLGLGDVAVWVAACAAHRNEAFLATRQVIDEIKQCVPIWKKEHYADGQSDWVNCERCADPRAHAHHAL